MATKKLQQRASGPGDKKLGEKIRTRRVVAGMSQDELGKALGVSFQQIQKYEKGTSRISASRLQHTAHVLQVPVTFLFEGAQSVPGALQVKGAAPSPAYVSDFLATSEGLALTKAFMQIKDKKLRRRIVGLVEEIADQ
jgi:transcriptional regulator with XRE-family HTH domain